MTDGRTVTFYSFKGGVGRSFLMANSAVLLAQWGYNVLAIDWDVEAPGLDSYFKGRYSIETPGVLEYLDDCAQGSPGIAERYTSNVDIDDLNGRLSFMPASRAKGDEYVKNVQALNWKILYEENQLALHLEALRAEWVENYDFVLIDSRTGLTDYSGITTAQLPDALFFLFTANHQSLDGCSEIAKRAVKARQRMPVDRPMLITVPVLCRFDEREEYDRAKEWKRKIAGVIKPFVSGWLPKGAKIERLLEHLSIPYQARWSFGEELCVLQEHSHVTETISPTSHPVSYAIETLCAYLANDFGSVDLALQSRDEYVLTAKNRADNSRTEQYANKVYVSYDYQDAETANRIINRLIESFGSSISIVKPVQLESENIEFVSSASIGADAMIMLVGGTLSKFQSVDLEQFERERLRSRSPKTLIPVVLTREHTLGSNSALWDYRFVEAVPYTKGGDVDIDEVVSLISDRLKRVITSKTTS